MPKIETIISSEEQKAWKEFCALEGKSSSEILRSFIRYSIEKETLFDAKQKVDTEKLTEQINLKLSATQVQDIQEKAKKEGFEKATKWIRSLVMSVLYKDPILTDKEMTVLRESRSSLASIGRNFNQVTRAINIDFRESDKLKFEMIEDLKKMLEEHKKHTTVLVQKSASRWER